MEVCECGNPTEEHHPSWHYAQKRDALMVKIGAFMDEVYPAYIFVSDFNRKQVALIAACYILDKIEGNEREEEES